MALGDPDITEAFGVYFECPWWFCPQYIKKTVPFLIYVFGSHTWIHLWSVSWGNDLLSCFKSAQSFLVLMAVRILVSNYADNYTVKLFSSTRVQLQISLNSDIIVPTCINHVCLIRVYYDFPSYRGTSFAPAAYPFRPPLHHTHTLTTKSFVDFTYGCITLRLAKCEYQMRVPKKNIVPNII